MAAYYVWHAAVGAGTGADWDNAFIRLNTAMTGRAAGDVFYVADDHVETAATSTTYTSPGTEATPCTVYCMLRVGGSVPPVAADLRTTAQIITTSTSNISLAGMVRECNGIIFSAGSSTSSGSISVGATLLTWRLVNCALRLSGNSSSSRINLGVHGAYTILKNCTVQFANVGQGIAVGGRVSIQGPSTTSFITGATIPTNLFIPGTLVGHLFAEGVDFSAVASGKNLYIGTVAITHYAVFKDCKLGAGGIVSGTIPNTGALELVAIRCDAGDVNYRSEKYNRTGTQTTETVIVRSGSATDGVTPISYKVVLGSAQSAAFECLPISFWNETVGSPITVRLEAIHSGGAIPSDKQVWIDVVYLGTSGSSIGSRASTGLASWNETAVANPASSATWAGGLSDAGRFYMSVTITPQEKGFVTIYVIAAIGGGPVYIDPKPVIS